MKTNLIILFVILGLRDFRRLLQERNKRRGVANRTLARPFRRFGRRFLGPALRDKNKTVCMCLKSSTEHGKDRPSGSGLSASQTIVRTLLGCYGRPIDCFQCIPQKICQVSGEIRESHDRLEKGKHRSDRDKMRTARQISRSKK